MRSCFVPNCDNLCKNMTKRMMFIPPKNQNQFNLWKSVLPNRRELKPTDRICERHFRPSDIYKTFDHIINGVLHQIDRGKPKLGPNAVPYLNLPADDSACTDTKHTASETLRKSKKQREIVKPIHSEVSTKTRRPIIKRLMKDSSNKKRAKDNTKCSKKQREGREIIDGCTFLENVNSTQVDHNDEQLNVEIQVTTCEFEDSKVESPSPCGKINERIGDVETLDELGYDCVDATLFDGIYEDIYEVTLPNTLWGIHRDPSRMYIVFSYFDATTCSTSKLVHVDSAMTTQIYIRGKSVRKWFNCSLSIEYLTNLVSEVDEYRICDKFDANGQCKVLAAERNLCTVCRLNKD
ncbi:uncharacterized protein LOC119068584 [Bradysia coprophila]|uniref:uncharacterized protein LOC119068584 n=1 Tax=Bradysia coprophila TaxID=38358 RepID=UPI00187D708D|nr:uncharacterized protein LOC119068584 [Bradysia coprophila]